MELFTDKKLIEILDSLDASLIDLARAEFENPKSKINNGEVTNFLLKIYDARLEKILESHQSNIHHLESGMKNKIIQRKHKLMEKITNLSRN